MNRINLAQERDLWRAHVNTIMNIRLLYNFGKFLSSCSTARLAGSLEEICL
jgi:hypothetical protein